MMGFAVALLSVVQNLLITGIVALTVLEAMKLRVKTQPVIYYALMQVGNGVTNLVQISTNERDLFIPSSLLSSPTITYQIDVWKDDKIIGSHPFNKH